MTPVCFLQSVGLLVCYGSRLGIHFVCKQCLKPRMARSALCSAPWFPSAHESGVTTLWRLPIISTT